MSQLVAAKLSQRTPAGLGRRFAALVVDCLLCVGVAALFTRPNPPGIASAVVLFVSYSTFIGFWGQTPGMRLFGLACVDLATGQPIGLARGALRTLLLQLVVPAVFLDTNRRGWHDRAGGSIVIAAQ